jgi:hypothetical protein
MQTILVTIAFFGVVVTAMAVGVIFSGKSLRGSCGGTGTNCECTETKRRACAAAAHESASS